MLHLGLQYNFLGYKLFVLLQCMYSSNMHFFVTVVNNNTIVWWYITVQMSVYNENSLQLYWSLTLKLHVPAHHGLVVYHCGKVCACSLTYHNCYTSISYSTSINESSFCTITLVDDLTVNTFFSCQQIWACKHYWYNDTWNACDFGH